MLIHLAEQTYGLLRFMLRVHESTALLHDCPQDVSQGDNANGPRQLIDNVEPMKPVTHELPQDLRAANSLLNTTLYASYSTK